LTKFKNIAPAVFRHMNPSDYLEALYCAVKAEKESYSYIEFAEDLGFSKSNVVHLMVRRKRPITVKSGERIAEAIGLKGLERRYWLNIVALSHSHDEIEREQLMVEIVELRARSIDGNPQLQNQLEFFTEWFHSILFEMTSLKNFDEDPKVLAASLEPRIRPEQAKRSLALLEDLGLLVRRDGKLVAAKSQLSTGDEVALLGVVRYHQHMIDLGRRSLTAIDSDRRDISSISFACNEAFAADLKKEISVFRKKILAMAEKIDEKDRVYQMNLQLFPVSEQKD